MFEFMLYIFVFYIQIFELDLYTYRLSSVAFNTITLFKNNLKQVKFQSLYYFTKYMFRHLRHFLISLYKNGNNSKC